MSLINMEIKITVRRHFAPTRMAVTHTETKPNPAVLARAWPLGTRRGGSSKKQCNSTSGHVPEPKAETGTDMCTPTFTAHSSQQPAGDAAPGSTAAERIHRTWSSHTRGHHSGLKWKGV